MKGNGRLVKTETLWHCINKREKGNEERVGNAIGRRREVETNITGYPEKVYRKF